MPTSNVPAVSLRCIGGLVRLLLEMLLLTSPGYDPNPSVAQMVGAQCNSVLSGEGFFKTSRTASRMLAGLLDLQANPVCLREPFDFKGRSRNTDLSNV